MNVCGLDQNNRLGYTTSFERKLERECALYNDCEAPHVKLVLEEVGQLKLLALRQISLTLTESLISFFMDFHLKV